MFERRLKIVMLLVLLPITAVVVRLVQLQVIAREDYLQAARQMLARRPQYFPFVRGDITDRHGRRLAYDAPAWDICVDYETIDRDASRWADREGRVVSFAERLRILRDPGRIAPSWKAIAEFTGTPISELLTRAAAIRNQVHRIKEIVSERRGVETIVAEERMAHPVAFGLDPQQRVAASMTFAAYDNVEIQASHVRKYTGGPAVGQLLGRLGEVDDRAIADDPLGEDDLARYRPGSLHGVSGTERLGEMWMRGRRGRVHNDADGQPITPPVEPVDGKTFHLTIDLAVQEALYARLAEAVQASPFQTGGCAVVIHVPTRQVLALVNYPSVDPTAPADEWAEAAADLARRPLLSRAIRAYYPPGSIVKPMLLAAGLADGTIRPDTHFTCYGHLLPEVPDAWRCTGRHGSIGPVYAIQHSCNVFFYHVGELMGVDRICEWYRQFGFGRLSGSGLVGELPGRLPAQRTRGQARNSAIGQAFDVTPIQVANMTATLASGRYQPVQLWLDDPEPGEIVPLPVPDATWRLVRQGMYDVVNRPGGTAYGPHRAMIEDPDYVLLGKTGSAQVVHGRTIETKFFCHLPDGRVQEIVAPDRDSALAKADCPPDQRDQITITGWRSHRRYPPDAPQPYTHAWFIGYLAPRNGYLAPVRSGASAVAIAVVIEYAGHGGEVASPVARDMLQIILDHHRNAEGGAHEASNAGISSAERRVD